MSEQPVTLETLQPEIQGHDMNTIAVRCLRAANKPDTDFHKWLFGMQIGVADSLQGRSKLPEAEAENLRLAAKNEKHDIIRSLVEAGEVEALLRILDMAAAVTRLGQEKVEKMMFDMIQAEDAGRTEVAEKWQKIVFSAMD